MAVQLSSNAHKFATTLLTGYLVHEAPVPPGLLLSGDGLDIWANPSKSEILSIAKQFDPQTKHNYLVFGFIAFPKSENILIWIEPSKQLESERSVLSALQLTDDEVAQAGAMIGTFGLIQEHLRFEGELEMVDYGSVNLSVLDSNILKGKFRWLYDRYGFVDFMPK